MRVIFSSIAVLVLSFIARPQAFAVADRPDGDVPAPHVRYFVSPEDNSVVTQVVKVEPQLPRGPNDILEDYEAEMANITNQMSNELGAIYERMAKGQLSREQGESLARERYQVATMQFQLLSALHAILEKSVAQAPPPPTRNDSPATEQSLVLALPFSSLQLNPDLAEYLKLTPQQSSAITQVMARERTYVAALMVELCVTLQKLPMPT